ncbi:MAG: aminomethyl transferase family protein, partial [Candidatus Latescibacteria bacterium]|nr:aminomethyl transferase family protein [Candidatus Latescibacterota bacterium]
KMLADMTVYAQDDALLIDTEPGMSQTLSQLLDRYLLIDDVTMADVTDHLSLIAVHGPRSTDLLAALIGPFSPLNVPQHLTRDVHGIPLLITRTNRTGEAGYDLYVPPEHAGTLWSALLDRGRQFGARPVGLDALDVLRVEAGIPQYGVDMNDNIIPVEARITERAVSFTKGCYIGQETVAMITYRGRPNKLLVGLRVEGEAMPARGSKILNEGQEVGWVTSGVRSLSLDGVIALGYVKRNYTESGNHLTVVVGESTVGAEVVELPFYRPQRSEAS